MEVPTGQILDLEIESVESTTLQGSTISTLTAGEIGFFDTSLASNATSSVLVTVSVLASDQTTLGVGFFKSVIGQGDSDIILGFQIPKDTVSGIADVYVNVFTDWPELGGVPVADEVTAHVEIIGCCRT